MNVCSVYEMILMENTITIYCHKSYKSSVIGGFVYVSK